MNIDNPIWRFVVALFLSIITAASCQQADLPAENTTENISAEIIHVIPEGIAPQRPETYDDIVGCGRITTYRANCPYVGPKTGADWSAGPDYIRGSEVTLTGWEFATSVGYRDQIETRAGEIRYNLLSVTLETDAATSDELIFRAHQTGRPTAIYEIKQRGTCTGIWVRKVGEINWTYGGIYLGHRVFYLTIEISPQTKPGDYTLYFVVEANGQICGEVPCVIHVIE